MGNRKRMRFSCGSDFASPSKRLKGLSTQNHESSAASPVLDNSYSRTISKHEITFDMVSPRKLEKVENDLQNIEEESKSHTSFDNSLSLISLKNSQAEEGSMVTAAISGFDSDFKSQSKLP